MAASRLNRLLLVENLIPYLLAVSSSAELVFKVWSSLSTCRQSALPNLLVLVSGAQGSPEARSMVLPGACLRHHWIWHPVPDRPQLHHQGCVSPLGAVQSGGSAAESNQPAVHAFHQRRGEFAELWDLPVLRWCIGSAQSKEYTVNLKWTVNTLEHRDASDYFDLYSYSFLPGSPFKL